MSVGKDNLIGELPADGEKPYKPYYAMRDKFYPLIEKSKLPVHTVYEAIAALRRGIMLDKGSLVEISSGVYGGIDLATVEIKGREMIVSPSPKPFVDDDTDKVVGWGALVLTSDYEDCKMTGVYRHSTGFETGRGISRIDSGLILQEYGIDAPRYKILQEDTGMLICRTEVSPPRTFSL